MLASLVRLQALAFWRAPYLGGRIALAVVKGLGVAYAVVSAALLGFVLPDFLGVAAPGLRALPLVEAALLPALGILTVGRLLFQDVPTRGATAFLLLPVSRRRVAAGVLARSAPSPLNLVPLMFVIPFAARVVRADAGTGGAWAFVLATLALVALSHALLVLWKTRLGAQPVGTVALLVGAVLAVVGLDVWTGGLMAAVRSGEGWLLAVLGVLAVGTLAVAYHGLVASLYLDGGGIRRVRGAELTTGFSRGGVRAFIDLDLRLVTRTPFPRGIVTNAVLVGLALTAFALLADEGLASDLLIVFSAGTVAGSFGQFTLSFASGYYDRLLTLPGAVEDFVRAKLAVIAVGTLWLALLQLGVVLAIEPASAWLVGVSVLFSLGVLAPAALWGATLGPKPLDVSERMMFNYKPQSFGAQVLIGATAVVAGTALTLVGPTRGALVAGLMGLAGVVAAPLWLHVLARRIHRRRHVVSARFRSNL